MHTKFEFQKSNNENFLFFLPILGWKPHVLTHQKYSPMSNKTPYLLPKLQMQKLPLQPKIQLVNSTFQPNVHQNFEVKGQEEDLCFQDIEINDDNKQVIKNAGPPSPDPIAGRWIKPSICSRRSLNVSNFSGNWRDKSWSEVADMDEFALFRMSFSESFIIDVLIPETNKNIEGEKFILMELYL